jgi:hypothetical protein
MGAFRASRNRYWFPVVGLVCLLIVATWLDFAGRSQKVVFHESDCERIRIGMTRAESELGLPPGNYETENVVPLSSSLGDYGAVEWLSDEGELRVWFDEYARVEKCEFRKPALWNRSLFSRLRDWIGI